VQSCDVVWHNNISLKFAWPLLFLRRPWVVTHQTWIAPVGRPLTWREQAKYRLLRRTSSVSISQAIAATIPVKSTIIGNPYRADIFRLTPVVRREREIVFLGRLVWDKGADLLIQAIASLRERGMTPALSIVGAGPEEMPLRKLVAGLKLETQVEFHGSASGPPLAQMLNRHLVIVVPSRWAEPFGIVALEGIACGCAAIGSSGGGLPDAIGAGGIVFESGSVPALAAALERVLDEPGLRESLTQCAEDHLRGFTPASIAAKYLQVFSETIQRE
jgi:glycosyltransferase involved in cell wall biosynthesis